MGSWVSFCQSTSWRSQPISPASESPGAPPSGLGPVAFGSSLYFQCAATPYSAMRCISWVRIWISTGLPPGPTTVVCRDW